MLGDLSIDGAGPEYDRGKVGLVDCVGEVLGLQTQGAVLVVGRAPFPGNAVQEVAV